MNRQDQDQPGSGYRPPAELYPFTSNWLELAAGLRMHYLDEGPKAAPVVLMLHGNPSWSFYYRRLVLALRDRFRCIVPDHIGCGLSDKPSDQNYDYRLASRVRDLGMLVEKLGLTAPLHMVVHDWGGMIGWAWAVRQQRALHSAVILNTAAFPIPPDKRLPFSLWLAGRTPLGAPLVRGANAFARGAARVGFCRPVAAEVRAAFVGPYDSWANRIATLRFVQDIPLKAGDPGYELVQATDAGLARYANTPALIAWGLRDFVFDARFLKAWRTRLPAAEVQEYADCGHYVLEDAAPDLVPRIRAFLDRQEGQNGDRHAAGA